MSRPSILTVKTYISESDDPDAISVISSCKSRPAKSVKFICQEPESDIRSDLTEATRIFCDNLTNTNQTMIRLIDATDTCLQNTELEVDLEDHATSLSMNGTVESELEADLRQLNGRCSRTRVDNALKIMCVNIYDLAYDEFLHSNEISNKSLKTANDFPNSASDKKILTDRERLLKNLKAGMRRCEPISEQICQPLAIQSCKEARIELERISQILQAGVTTLFSMSSTRTEDLLSPPISSEESQNRERDLVDDLLTYEGEYRDYLRVCAMVEKCARLPGSVSVLAEADVLS